MLQREMARVSQRDENYESQERALQAAIQELRKMISANTRERGTVCSARRSRV